MLEGKNVAILIERDFDDPEVLAPLRAIRDAGARVTLVGSGSQRSYWGKGRSTNVSADASAELVKAEDFDAIIIPGGYAPDKMRMHQPMIDLVVRANELGKLVAAVCHGPQLLISANMVKGRRLTSWPSVAVDLRNAGASWLDESVVQDGNLITSREPADLPEFCSAIIKALRAQSDRDNTMAGG